MRYAPQLATGARGPSNEGMLILPPGSDRMFLHTHPGGAPVASSPRLDDIHIAMRFVMEAYHCEALVVPPNGEGNPAYDAAFGDAPEPEPPKPEPTWDEALENFEETLATWLGLADEDPTKPRSAEARYLVPEVVPDPSATAADDATSSSASSTVSSSPTAETASGSGAVRGDAPAGARAAKEELARLRERLAFLEAKAVGDEALEALETARLEAVAGSKAEPVSRTAASARVSAAPLREARPTRPRLVVPRPLRAR